MIMKKNTFYKFSLILISFYLFFQSELYAQITINNTSNTVTQLVNGVLVPPGSGTIISNVVFSGVYNNSNRYQVGSFTTVGSTLSQMGFSKGVVLTSGNTSTIPLTLGTNPGNIAQMATAYTSGTPGELRQTGSPAPPIIQDLDVLAGAYNYFNGAILEFDFIPIDTKVQFRYIFGSEEYSDGTNSINYQCSSYNDKFGFLISGPGISGGQGFSNDAKNIARLANGSEVSINSVNNGVVGSSASSQNATYCTAANGGWTQNTPTPEFGLNNGHIDGTQLNGNTKILTASQSGLIPGQTYHIKLIVTDVNDATYDSVVYLEAGSFTTSQNCAAGIDQTLCSTTSTTLAATSPLTGTWSITSGTALFSNINSPNSGVTGLSNGVNVLKWTASDSSCFDEVSITVNAAIPIPTLNTIPASCTSSGTTTITNYNNIYTYTFNPTGPIVNTSGIISGATIGVSYTVTSSYSGCISLPSMPFANGAQTVTPSAPIIGTITQPTCSTSTGSVALSGLPASGTWTVTANPGGATISNTGTIAIFSGLSPNTYMFTITNSDGCTSADSGFANILSQPAPPSAPTVVTPVTYCQNATASNLTATGSNLLWYTAATGGTGSATAPTPSTASAGSTTYYVSQTVLGCESPRASITVTVNATPVAPSVTTPVTYCQNVIASNLTATGSNLLWYTAATGGTGSATAPTPSTASAGSTTYYVSQTVLGCESPRASITVNITASPLAPIVGTITQPTCSVASGSVALSGLPASGTWTVTSNPGGSTISNSGTTAVFAGLSPNAYTFTVTNASGCISGTSTNASILGQPSLPVPPSGPSNQSFCENENPTIGDLIVTGTNIKWYDTLVGGNLLPLMKPLENGTTYYASQMIGNCESNRLAITVTITQLPNVVITDGCNGTDYVATATTTQNTSGLIYEWYSASNLNLIIGTNPSIIIPTKGDYILKILLNGCFKKYPISIESLYCDIPKGISPNGDDKNEFFDLSNLNVKKLEIFNRYGMKVYSHLNYKKEWDGRTDNGQELPDGTYYYLIEFENRESTTGWVYLSR